MSRTVETVLSEQKGEMKELAERYKEHLRPVMERYERKHNNEPMPDKTFVNTVQCMENVRNQVKLFAGKQGLNEATYTDALSTLQRHGLQIIAALMPSLIAEEIVSVQAIDRRTAEIYFMDYDYGTSKSGVSADATMIGAKTGQVTTTYKYTLAEDTYAIGTGDGATANFTATLRFIPVLNSSVTITAVGASGTMTVTDNGAGVLVGDVGSGNNTINITTGALDVTFEQNVTDAASVTIVYSYDWEKMGAEGVPELNISVTTVPVTAKNRLLRANWFIGAEYDMEKVHGRSMKADILQAQVAEIRHEIDAEIMDMLLTDSATNGASTITFDLTSPYTQVGKWEYYKELVFTLERASEAIFQETKRGFGNFIVTGEKLMALLSGLDDFEPALKPGSQPPSGPHRAGIFRGKWVVYRNPFYASNKFLLGYKGDSWANAGAVYAPYMPAVTTDIVTLDDFKRRNGTLTSYAKSMVNSKFYVNGTILET